MSDRLVDDRVLVSYALWLYRCDDDDGDGGGDDDDGWRGDVQVRVMGRESALTLGSRRAREAGPCNQVGEYASC